jgi:hypothetical protein
MNEINRVDYNNELAIGAAQTGKSGALKPDAPSDNQQAIWPHHDKRQRGWRTHRVLASLSVVYQKKSARS